MTESTGAVAIDVAVACDAWPAACPEAPQLVEIAARAALAGAHGRLAIDIVLADDAELARLNRTWRGNDAPTNVLAFPLGEPVPVPPEAASVLLGDIALAFETIAREAVEQEKPLADHLRHLVVHGVLHLLGFDHQNEAEAAAMEAREVEILRALGVPDPYRDIM